MIVGVKLSSGNSGNNHHLTILFEGGMHSFKRCCVCVSRNWRHESEPPLKPSQLTCGTNLIIVLRFVKSQRTPVRYVTKPWNVVLLNKKKHELLSQAYCVWHVVKTPTNIFNNSVFTASGTNQSLLSLSSLRWQSFCVFYPSIKTRASEVNSVSPFITILNISNYLVWILY